MTQPRDDNSSSQGKTDPLPGLPAAPPVNVPTNDPIAGHAPAVAQLIRMELILGSILSVGVWGSLFVILFGVVLCFLNADHYRGGDGALAALTTPESADINSLSEVFSGLVRLDGPSIVMLGVVILISTPAIRVAVSMAVYIRQRDRTYVILTGAVLLLLLFGYFKKQDKPSASATQPVSQVEPAKP